MVERRLPKPNVAGSSPVSRSIAILLRPINKSSGYSVFVIAMYSIICKRCQFRVISNPF